MVAVAFDTHRFVKRLTDAGMPVGQAEVLAEEHAGLLITHLATKDDIRDMATKQDLEILKRDMTIRLGSMVVVAVGVVAALVKLL